jgi:hypothetical protein
MRLRWRWWRPYRWSGGCGSGVNGLAPTSTRTRTTNAMPSDSHEGWPKRTFWRVA